MPATRDLPPSRTAAFRNKLDDFQLMRVEPSQPAAPAGIDLEMVGQEGVVKGPGHDLAAAGAGKGWRSLLYIATFFEMSPLRKLPGRLQVFAGKTHPFADQYSRELLLLQQPAPAPAAPPD